MNHVVEALMRSDNEKTSRLDANLQEYYAKRWKDTYISILNSKLYKNSSKRYNCQYFKYNTQNC